MKGTKTQKGITLIALIITILVLLILAGVSIRALRKDDGVIVKAQEAANSYKEAQIEEEVKLYSMEYTLKTQKNLKEETVNEMTRVSKETGVSPAKLTVHTNKDGSEYVLYRIDKVTAEERTILEQKGAKALIGDVDLDGVLTLNDAELLNSAGNDGMINGEEWFDENGEIKEKFKLWDIDNDGGLGASDAGFIEYIIINGGEYTGGYIE